MIILCTVDITTREVTIPSYQRIASYDHKVDVIRFQVETIPGFSLDTSSIKIAAQGPNKARHDYSVDPSTVSIEEETGYITFDWPIPAGVTEMPIGTFKYGDRGQLIFAVCAEIISGNTMTKAWHSDDGIITVVAHLEPEAGGGEDPEEEATNAQKIAQLQTDVAVMGTQIGALGNGSPTPAGTVAEMTEHDKVYLYTGSESGYTAGNWYYYNGTAWISGGTYGGGGAVTDTTLSISGKAADAKATRDALALKADADDVGDLSQLTTTAKDNLVSAINEENEALTAVNGRLTQQSNLINEIAGAGTETTADYIEVTNPDPNVAVKTNNVNGNTTLKLGISQGNIICLPYFRPNGFSKSGLTFTINDDGSITVNGTATEDVNYNIAYSPSSSFQFTRVGPRGVKEYGYYISGCTDGSDTTYFIRDANTGYACKTQPVAVFSSNVRGALNLTLVVKSGVTLTDKTFYPMLSRTKEEAYTPPIPQSKQYTATVESTDTEHTWTDLQFYDGYNVLVTSGGNTVTITTEGYETFSDLHEEIDALAQNIGNPWKGKKWVAFGTSITDNWSTNSYITQGEHTGEHTGKYVPYLLDMSELSESEFYNRGISGGSINGHILYYIRYYAAAMANADLITIEGAVNDFATNVPLGNVGDTVPYTHSLLTDGTAEGSFAGACYQAFTTAQTNAPNAVVVLLTETTGKDHTGYANYNQLRKNSLGLYQSDYIDMTMKVAEFVGIPVINCGRDSMINAQNPQYIADHIHHTFLGGYQYAKVIWSKLKGIPLKQMELPA